MAILKLSLSNVYGDPLDDSLDIVLRHQQLSGSRTVRVPKAKSSLVIKDLEPGIYKVEVDPATYLPVSAFGVAVEAHAEAVPLVFPFDLRKVQPEFPEPGQLSSDCTRVLEASTNVTGFTGLKGSELYSALDILRRTGLLNVMTKSCATVLPNGKCVAAYFEELCDVRGDRFFVKVSQQLRDEAKNGLLNGLFGEAPNMLHHPPAGMNHAGSFKTRDRYGNLQLTFFTDGTKWAADVDIDDAAGLEHVFQVVRNAITDEPTNPFSIHQILFRYQKIDTLVRLRRALST
jgi:hypothetical protein